MIEAFRSQLMDGEPSPDELARRFAELAAVESHCNSAKRGGDLGFFGCGAGWPCLIHRQARKPVFCQSFVKPWSLIPLHPPTLQARPDAAVF
jgi:hypothetical protein